MKKIFNMGGNTVRDEQKIQHWESLLGKSVLEKALTHNNWCKQFFYMKEKSIEVDIDVEYLFELWNRFGRVEEEEIKNVTFSNFYKPFVLLAKEKLQKNLLELTRYYSDSVYADLAKRCVILLQKISVRTLIYQMHECKQNGELKGNTSSLEYEDFNANNLTDIQYVKEMFERFPVLYKTIMDAIDNAVTYYTEIIKNYKHDYESLRNKFYVNDANVKLVRIAAGMGDGHNHNRQVVRVTLENGVILLYKPHDMKADIAYNQLLQWMEQKSGITQKNVPIVVGANYGWCGCVNSKSCRTAQQMEAYYVRFGVHLFLTWILGTRDLHSENVIASGEYPVIVDLEVLLSAMDHQENSIKDAMLNELASSVLFSGLLPYYHWNNGGEGIDNSAINGNEGQRYPFRIPVIVDDKTSHMRVEYEQPISHSVDNLATLNGQFMSPAKYEEKIISGFMSAAQVVLDNKAEFMERIVVLKDVDIRSLIIDTQKYSMLLNSSYHPELLKDVGAREMFLNAIWGGRKDEDANIVKAEIKSMLRGDIPLFYCKADATELYSDEEIIQLDFFSRSAYQMLIERIQKLNKAEIEKQCDEIALSLRMINDEERRYLNRIYSVKEWFALHRSSANKCQNNELLDRILKYAVWNNTRTMVSWYTVQFGEGENMNWTLIPMNMYLYDGLAGMLVIMEAILKKEKRSEVVEISKTLRKTLFDYTDSGIKNKDLLESTMTGAYEGEGSLVYAYLLLYRITAEKDFLFYAEKHASIVINLLDVDPNADIISGKAGAAQTLLGLYSITKKTIYLDAARHAVELLRKTAHKQTEGVGWVTDDISVPMAGMAHGNAGILMPIVWLYDITKENHYIEFAEEVWRYENSLYNFRSCNWNDARILDANRDDIGAVSWCHGAPGVLLSRIFCFDKVDDEKWKQRFLEEMTVAYKKLKEYWKRDSWSLCHGNCGNLWILQLAEEFFEKQGIIVEKSHFVAEQMKEICWTDDVGYLPQEILNPGLMNGYGGVLLALSYFM